MPTSRPLTSLLAVAMLAIATPSHAFDPSSVPNAEGSPREVLRYGYNALKNGHVDDAVEAFSWGAEHKNVAAQWKLARMKQTADGVARDEIGALALYRTIVSRFDGVMPGRYELPFVSSATVALGQYALNGLPEANMNANPDIAESYFYRAAALYQDAEAQYRLGSLYLSGTLGTVRATSAARWLGLSARKGHPYAQAELGHMLVEGKRVRRQMVRGLVLLAQAGSQTDTPQVHVWRDTAFAAASKTDRVRARKILNALSETQPMVNTDGVPVSDAPAQPTAVNK
ncbi:sel1 repeat family protein [Rhizobiaceae bacterium]|nr:sel1 repeat family protein [Rhizobiaceae bacterium]